VFDRETLQRKKERCREEMSKREKDSEREREKEGLKE
jgi:hypothetical protein